MSIESGMLVTCLMQCAMSVSLLLLLTARISRSVHVSPRDTLAVITLCEILGYVDITCVMSVLSLLCHSLYLMIFGAEDSKQHLDYMRFVACI